MKTVAVITAKRFTRAKQRLSGSMDPDLRRQLVEAMLGDVLEAVSESRMVSGTVVVTGEDAAVALAVQRTGGRAPAALAVPYERRR